MFTFKSPVDENHIWKLCFRDPNEVNRLFYEHNPTPESERTDVLGFVTFPEMTIFISNNLDGFALAKTLRHEITHLYLWETGQEHDNYDEEMLANFIGSAAPAICKTVDNILLRLKEGLYKHGE